MDPMDALIMERDELVGSMLVDMLDDEKISAAVLADEEALRLPPDQPPRLVITDMNRTYTEDLRGLVLVSALRRKWPRLRAIYLAAVWPARLSKALIARDRFLSKPFDLAAMISAVRQLLPLDDESTRCQVPPRAARR
jgi:DNA-binding response OmpR family regulator